MVSSGISSIDDLLNRGYPEKSTILIAGPPGIGKEALGYWFVQKSLADGDFCLCKCARSLIPTSPFPIETPAKK